MKKYLLLLLLLPAFAYGAFAPVTWDGDFSAQIVQPLSSFYGANIKGSYFTATSTTASTLPNASTTALTVATELDLLGTKITNIATWFSGLFDSNLASKDTDDLTQGSTNLYWSNALFDTRLNATTSLPSLATLAGLSTIGSSTGQTTILGKTIITNASSTNATVSGFLTRYEEKGFSVASTSPDRLGNKFATATTTWQVINFSRASTVSKFYCKTDTGTLRVRIGDGTNFTEDGSCTSSGTEVTTSSNNTFTARENMVIEIGTSASTPNWVTITPTIQVQI